MKKSISLTLFALLASIASAESLKGLKLDGERFTYDDGKGSVRGILVKPQGTGPFPALLISHGMGSNGERFGRMKAADFVKLGYVCIAPDYTHSDPKAADRATFGASAENVRRAIACLDILKAQPGVDAKRIYAYGNSMGAFLTIGLAADHPGRLAAAAITAGGITPADGFPAPSKDRAENIKTPFLILHGTADTTVPAERSAGLEEILRTNKIPCERRLYDGIGHDLHAVKAAEVNSLIQSWFTKHPHAR